MATAKTQKPRHLGRGLASLISPVTTTQDAASPPIPIVTAETRTPAPSHTRDSLHYIPLAEIRPNSYQMRTVWNNQDLADLAASINANGVVQPIILRRDGQQYEIIAGERRFRAAKLAGLEAIPAVVRNATNEQMLELALVENIHRTDLNPIERGKAYQSYISRFNLTQADAAERLGEDRSVIANHLRLLDLPDEVHRMLIEGQLSMGHARAILAVPTDELRTRLARRAMAGRLSVREVERLVKRHLMERQDSSKKTNPKAAYVADLETRMSRQLGTRVAIQTRKGGQRGRIVIEFYSLDEFDRIAEKIGVEVAEQV